MRWIGISGRTIGAVSTEPLQGRTTIDAKGLVVAPGFIDLHEHGQDFEAYTFQARDGVTSTFELEVGTADVPGWYKARENKSAINHGVSIGHIQVRMKVMKDPGDFLPSGPGARETASADQVAEMKRLMEEGLRQGAVAAGFGMVYTPAATRWEILEMFRMAAKHRASCHVHLRRGPRDPRRSRKRVWRRPRWGCCDYGRALHVVHINSSSRNHAPQMLQILREARDRGLDVTTEMYPYIAGCTRINPPASTIGWIVPNRHTTTCNGWLRANG